MKQPEMHIFAIAALTKDKRIAQEKDQVSTDWTSQEDKDWFWNRTAQAGAVVMGSTTFFATRKPGWPLPDRMNYVLTGDPEALWQKYSDEERAQVRQKTNLAFLTGTPEEVIARAAADGFAELAVCGGTSVYTAFMEAGVLQTLYLTRENAVSFGGKGLPLFSTIDVDAYLAQAGELVSEKTVNDRGTVFQEWKVK